ncbi:MAG: pilus assembly protein TadG-related protein [Pseudomonadota bacterium]
MCDHVWMCGGLIKRFRASIGGQFALFGALLSPVLLGGVAATVDHMSYIQHRDQLQAAADSAALASAKEANLQGWTDEVASAIAGSYLAAHIEEVFDSGQTYTANTVVEPNNRRVTVEINQDHYPYFLSLAYPSPQITVSATAESSSNAKVCLLGMMPPQFFAKSSIHMDRNSRLQADTCSIISNSDDIFGLRVDRSSSMTAEFVCSAGGVMRDWSAKITPRPITRCPKLDDPLLARPQPASSGCNYNNMSVTSDRRLSPGTYCGGLSISGAVNVTLDPGLYVISGGELSVTGGASFTGTDISIYLTGAGSTFTFGSDTTISLAAMKTGPTAGLLISEDRTVPHSFDFNPFNLAMRAPDVRLHTISSNDARTLLGTIYLPNSVLMIDAQAPVADTSAYTAIVVGRMWLREGPTLVLNADYSATDVPVPAGLGGDNTTLVN